MTGFSSLGLSDRCWVGHTTALVAVLWGAEPGVRGGEKAAYIRLGLYGQGELRVLPRNTANKCTHAQEVSAGLQQGCKQMRAWMVRQWFARVLQGLVAAADGCW